MISEGKGTQTTPTPPWWTSKPTFSRPTWTTLVSDRSQTYRRTWWPSISNVQTLILRNPPSLDVWRSSPASPMMGLSPSHPWRARWPQCKSILFLKGLCNADDPNIHAACIRMSDNALIDNENKNNIGFFSGFHFGIHFYSRSPI